MLKKLLRWINYNNYNLKYELFGQHGVCYKEHRKHVLFGRLSFSSVCFNLGLQIDYTQIHVVEITDIILAGIIIIKEDMRHRLFLKQKHSLENILVGIIEITKNTDTIRLNITALPKIAQLIVQKNNLVNAKQKKIIVSELTLLEQSGELILKEAAQILKWSEVSEKNLNTNYPFLESNILSVYEKFLKSKSNIMVLIGPPGTGKSTLLKQFILTSDKNQIKTSICSDFKTMTDPKLIQHVYKNTGNQEVFIFEDADELIKERNKGNDMMSLLLNKADGILSNNIKLVISTNLTSVKSIDPALIRPGRCFKVLQFKKLTPIQAQAVRNLEGLPTPDDLTGNDLTLSEIFNAEQSINQSIGFIN